MEGQNEDGKEIADQLKDYQGMSCRAVAGMIIMAIGDKGYINALYAGETVPILIDLEEGSVIPAGEFLEEVAEEVQDCADSNDSPMADPSGGESTAVEFPEGVAGDPGAERPESAEEDAVDVSGEQDAGITPGRNSGGEAMSGQRPDTSRPEDAVSDLNGDGKIDDEDLPDSDEVDKAEETTEAENTDESESPTEEERTAEAKEETGETESDSTVIGTAGYGDTAEEPSDAGNSQMSGATSMFGPGMPGPLYQATASGGDE